MPLEEEHHRRGHRFPAVFDECEGPLVPQDPVDMVPTEAMLSEAEDLETVQRVQVIGPGNTEQGAVKPRTRLLSFSTPGESDEYGLCLWTFRRPTNIFGN